MGPNIANDPRFMESGPPSCAKGSTRSPSRRSSPTGRRSERWCCTTIGRTSGLRGRPELFEQLANQAAMMLRNTQNYIQMATWAAHLQSIQQLGARLTRLRTVRTSARRSARS